MKDIINLQNIDSDNQNLVGSKAKNLYLLHKNGFNIPKGFVLNTSFYEDYLSHGHMPDLDIIENTFNKYFNKDVKVVVRSSANFEDTGLASFAGVYNSVTNVDLINLQNAIKTVYKSVSSEQAKNYYKNNGVNINKVKMSVIIQEQVNPIISGVCFTKNPINKSDEILIEYVEGLNVRYVSGEQTPKSLTYNRKTQTYNTSETANEYTNLLKTNISEFIKIENSFNNNPQDIEWAIDQNKKLIILQSRNIVFKQTGKFKENFAEVIVQGVGVSPGTAKGVIKFLDTSQTSENLQKSIKKDDILYAHSPRVDQIVALQKAKGIILGEASLLSHVAIRARELNIPCVGGIFDKSKLTEGTLIGIDGTSGIIFNGDLKNIRTKKIKDRFPDYFNKDKVSVYEDNEITFLYSIVGKNKAMLYLPKVGDAEIINKALNIFKDKINSKIKNIEIHKQGAWEGDRAPSTVLVQYREYIKVISDPKMSKIFKESCEYLDKLNIKKLTKHFEGISKEAHTDFIKGYNLWVEFKDSKDVNKLIEAAKYLDNSKNLSAILIGTVIIETFGRYYIEKNLPIKFKDRLSEILKGDIKSDNIKIKKLVKLSKMLSEYRNKEFETLSHKGVSFFDIIDYIYSNGFAEHVEKYQW